jgi:hypothetical protein
MCRARYLCALSEGRGSLSTCTDLPRPSSPAAASRQSIVSASHELPKGGEQLNPEVSRKIVEPERAAGSTRDPQRVDPRPRRASGARYGSVLRSCDYPHGSWSRPAGNVERTSGRFGVARASSGSDGMNTRETRLLGQYHLWYPRVRPDTWLPADLVAHVVRQQLQLGEPRWAVGPRVLSDTHFQFRGGRQDRSRLLRTRFGERSVLQPRLW